METNTEQPMYESANSRIYLQEENGKQVIVKVLNSEHPSPEKIVQFNNEYELTCDIQSSRIRRALKKGKINNRYALYLEYEEGLTLNEYIRGKAQPIEEKIAIAIEIAQSLSEVHELGIIHKDITPMNIVVRGDRQITLIDFGISSRVDLKTPHLGNPQRLEGTLSYISPEQTGRMNRIVDYRTDLYSLGVVLYRLFSGKLPFTMVDPLELVHAHIALNPEPLSQVNLKIPNVISRIVNKLMAKNAEDRYQSALGLRKDLATCLAYMEKGKSIPQMDLASFDTAGRFRIPEKLYGRKKELAVLMNAYKKTIKGKTQLLLVAGYSGTGKSALVNEIHKPITANKGYFVSGKFDQYQRATPNYAFIRALEDFVELLLTEDEASIVEWKERIRNAIGHNGVLLTEVIPNLELIIGPQEPVSELGPVEAQNRFNYTFQQFIEAIAQPAKPLVIFIDDLQWADPSSLSLLNGLMKAVRFAGLLVIGAYRDNEVDAQHPFMKTVEDLKTEGIKAKKIQVENLNQEHVAALLAETLQARVSDPEIEGLAHLIYRKTQGNSFFTIEFLKSLYEETLLTFDKEEQRWTWSVSAIAAQGITDNVVELMAGKIGKMHPATQQVLKFAACIGNKFDLDSLSVINQETPLHTLRNLWTAVEENFLLPLDNDHKLVTVGEKTYKSNIPRFKFSHDRVQQAAYSLIEPTERAQTHLEIGRLLWGKKKEVEEDHLFDIVNQLNQGRALITEIEEKEALRSLNLRAARKAKESIAYEAGLEYIKISLEDLPDNTWETDYEFALDVSKSAAELEYLNGNFDASEALVKATLERAKEPLEKAAINSILITQNMFSLKMEPSLEAAIYSLKILGVDFPDEDFPTHIGATVGEINELLVGKDLATLELQPECTDQRIITIVQLLGTMAPPAWIMGKVELWTLIVLTATRYSLKYGNTVFSPYPYTQYGMLLIAQGAFDLGYKIGEMACRLGGKWGNQSFAQKGIANHMFAEFILPWSKLSRENLPFALEGQKINLESGNYLWVGYSYGMRGGDRLYQGKPLKPHLEELRKEWLFTLKVKQAQASGAAEGIVLLLEYMCSKEPYVVGEEMPNVAEYRARMLAGQDFFSQCQHNIFSAQFAYLFGEFEEAYALAEEVVNFTGIVGAYCLQTGLLFYHALSKLRRAREMGSEAEKAEALEFIGPRLEQLEAWMVGSITEIGCKYQMLLAEKAMLEGDEKAAMGHYLESIKLAADDQLPQDEALANESLAELFISQHAERGAAVYLQEAHYLYHLWGARKKVSQLEQKYPKLLATKSRQKGTESTTGTFDTTSTFSSGSTSSSLDLRSVLKASQTLSEEIVRSRLFDKLMRVLIENAGADRGLIVLKRGDQLYIEAEGAVKQVAKTQIDSAPVNGSGKVPEGILQLVARTREDILLENASKDERFAGDNYIVGNNTLSVLCSPILNQGELVGLIYLENNLTTGAFTQERLEVIKLLSGQIAVSLQNVSLYENLEEKVRERTAEVVRQKEALEDTLDQLKLTQSQLVSAEKMASLGQLTAGIAHEMNNPVNFVAANIDSLKLNFEDVQQLIRQYESLKEQEDFDQKVKTLIALEEELDKDFLFDEISLLLNGIDEGARRTAEIVAGLRNFSRLDEDDFKHVNLHEGIESTLTLLGNKLSDRITIHKEYAILPEVECLPGKINQVLMNVFNNSIQAIDGEGDIFIKTQHVGEEVSISVRDTGVGMPQEVINKVFDPFFTTKELGEGTGLGLSISYGIIEKHGGRILVNSAEGEGSEFIIWLPVNFPK